MSPNKQRTTASATHTGRRRHAAPANATWARKAGLVGGVVSAIALCGAAAPALADNSHGASAKDSSSVAPAATTAARAATLTTSVTGQQAATAITRDAEFFALQDARQKSALAAAKAAAAKKKAAELKAAAAAKAAHERAVAAQAASRSAERTKLAAATPSPAPSPSSTTSAAPSSATGSAAKLISFLKSQLGKPYVYGATGPDSYDCSGLTQVAFQTVGVSLPRTSQEQSTVGTPVSISNLQPGDLIFWGGEGSAYHVGVFIGDGQYLDAANPSTPVAIHQLADYMPDWAVRVL
ncbi:C40 family peptidase [Streptomyces sp. NPDC051976]|uniref:C40 family peptidase n=1 Tax=Streptomyces sp. NPDC051976 TaxID=3154947 RepID=UPI0034354439